MDAEELVCIAKQSQSQESASLVAYLTTVGYVLHARKRIIAGLKDGSMDTRIAARLNAECDALMNRHKESEDKKDEGEEFVPEAKLVRPSLGLVRTSVISEDSVASIENEMLDMTAGMREVANVVRTSIRRDVHVLSATGEMQQGNLDRTRGQNVEAKSLRSSKRLSFFMTMLMIVASLAIFLALIPLMIITK